MEVKGPLECERPYSNMRKEISFSDEAESKPTVLLGCSMLDVPALSVSPSLCTFPSGIMAAMELLMTTIVAESSTFHTGTSGLVRLKRRRER